MRWFLALSLILSGISEASAEIINSSVGQVGPHVVTAREVWISNFLERWNLARKTQDPGAHTPKADWKLPLKSEAFHSAASSFMLEHMVAQEAVAREPARHSRAPRVEEERGQDECTGNRRGVDGGDGPGRSANRHA